MDDKYDLVGFFLSKDGLLRSGIIGLLEGTPLEESAGSLSFAIATFAVVNVVFLMLFFSQFAILWIERKAVARMQDRYGATTALRSLWVGENGVTAGEWWNMLPFGLGKPIGAVNKWLNKNFGNRDENFATVDRVNNRSWMGKTIVPGFFQNVADGMKFLVKEHMVPQRADRLIFEVSPFLIVSSTLLILGMIPLSSGIYATNPDLSILYAIAIFGIAPIGVFFAGWSSNNKYTLIGGIRSAAQLTAYEIPLLLTLLSVAILSGTFNIIESIHFQHSAGAWNIFLMPLGAALFLVTMIAEVERVPFDMPEAEAELVEGWWTEYGGMRFGMLFMAEYIRTYAACFLFTHFFLGGWHLPFHGTLASLPVIGEAVPLIPGAIVTLIKSWLVFLIVFVGLASPLHDSNRPDPRVRLAHALAAGRASGRAGPRLPPVPLQPRRHVGPERARRWHGLGRLRHPLPRARAHHGLLAGCVLHLSERRRQVGQSGTYVPRPYGQARGDGNPGAGVR